jgi:hypothetical protein
MNHNSMPKLLQRQSQGFKALIGDLYEKSVNTVVASNHGITAIAYLKLLSGFGAYIL